MPITFNEELPEAAFSLRFYADVFEPDDVTKRLGLEPTMLYRPGDPIRSDGKGERTQYGWRLRVGPQKTWQLDQLAADFRAAVDASGNTVRSLCSELSLEAVIVCEVSLGRADSTPALDFPADFLAWVASLGANLTVDVSL